MCLSEMLTNVRSSSSAASPQALLGRTCSARIDNEDPKASKRGVIPCSIAARSLVEALCALCAGIWLCYLQGSKPTSILSEDTPTRWKGPLAFALLATILLIGLFDSISTWRLSSSARIRGEGAKPAANAYPHGDLSTAYTSHMMPRVLSTQGLKNNSSSQSLSNLSASIKSFTISSCRKLGIRSCCDLVISSKISFVSVECIEQLTMEDIANVFRYSTQVNRKDFDMAATLSHVSSATRSVLTAMDWAVSASGGRNAVLALVDPHGRGGDTDALYFLAAARILAEWRSIHLVPPGHKRYAMGVSLGRRDMLQNIAKVETAVHAWIEGRLTAGGEDDSVADNSDESLVASPTLRQVLQHEMDTHVHSKLPRLADPSGASGLLWLKRQIDYQTSMMSKSLQVPCRNYPTTRDAIEAAYQEVYDKYHGWTTQQVFRQSFKGSPEFSEIFAPLTELFAHQQEVVATSMVPDLDQSPICTYIAPKTEDLDLDLRQKGVDGDVQSDGLGVLTKNIVKDISTGWESFVVHLSRFDCLRATNPKPRTTTSPFATVVHYRDDPHPRSFPQRTESDVSSISTESTDTLETTIEDTRSLPPLHRHIQLVCNELGQTLKDTDVLLEDMNMNDPTKV